MEHERYYALMMESLDGELNADNRVLLDLHLTDCRTCRREWHALVAIDRLLQQAPMLSPAADFTQRTLARLPNHRYRIWLMGLTYTLLLFSGLVPLLAGAWLVQRAAPMVMDPGLLWGLWQTILSIGQLMATVLNALLLGLGQAVSEQPVVTGTLLIMAGTIFLWSGIYRQMLHQPIIGEG
ncbi:MAG: zf-HC2 domain-containing protein [Chloroflexota bacterium]